jgi:hypothetical protein
MCKRSIGSKIYTVSYRERLLSPLSNEPQKPEPSRQYKEIQHKTKALNEKMKTS